MFFWDLEQNERARGLKTDHLFYEALANLLTRQDDLETTNVSSAQDIPLQRTARAVTRHGARDPLVRPTGGPDLHGSLQSAELTKITT